MWYFNKVYILIHQTYRIALTWHCFVELMKNTPCRNSSLMWMTFEVHSNLMLAEGFYTSPTCSCYFKLLSFYPQSLTTHEELIDGLVQDCSISSALAMEILQSYTKPSIQHLFVNINVTILVWCVDVSSRALQMMLADTTVNSHENTLSKYSKWKNNKPYKLCYVPTCYFTITWLSDGSYFHLIDGKWQEFWEKHFLAGCFRN